MLSNYVSHMQMQRAAAEISQPPFRKPTCSIPSATFVPPNHSTRLLGPRGFWAGAAERHELGPNERRTNDSTYMDAITGGSVGRGSRLNSVSICTPADVAITQSTHYTGATHCHCPLPQKHPLFRVTQSLVGEWDRERVVSDSFGHSPATYGCCFAFWPWLVVVVVVHVGVHAVVLCAFVATIDLFSVSFLIGNIS